MSAVFPALLWTAPELMAAQRSGVTGLSTGTQKGDVYSFAIILHEILYRAGLFRFVEDDEPIPPKSKNIAIRVPMSLRYYLQSYMCCQCQLTVSRAASASVCWYLCRHIRASEWRWDATVSSSNPAKWQDKRPSVDSADAWLLGWVFDAASWLCHHPQPLSAHQQRKVRSISHGTAVNNQGWKN